MNTDQLKPREKPTLTVSSISMIVLTIGFSLLPHQYARAQENAAGTQQADASNVAEDTFTLDLSNIDLNALIKIVSTQTGKNFIVDPRVKATVNFISSEPVSSDKLYELFLSVLEVHGFAAVDVGAFTKIVPTPTGVQSPIPLVNQQSAQGEQPRQQPNDDELVTQVVRLQGMQATDVVSVLQPLLPPSESINAEPTSNSVAITARQANIEKLVGLIQQMANQ